MSWECEPYFIPDEREADVCLRAPAASQMTEQNQGLGFKAAFTKINAGPFNVSNSWMRNFHSKSSKYQKQQNYFKSNICIYLFAQRPLGFLQPINEKVDFSMLSHQFCAFPCLVIFSHSSLLHRLRLKQQQREYTTQVNRFPTIHVISF